MAALNYAEQYQKALANAYPNVLHFAALRSTENDSRYKWVDGSTIKIPTLTTTGRTDADRDSIGERKRNYDNAWETKTLRNHRKWSTLVHPMDIDETNQVASITNITRTFNETQKFPEMDAYLISTLLADWKAAGGVEDNTVLTTENILTTFDAWMSAMDEENVPVDGRILYATPTTRDLIKNAERIQRQMMVGNQNLDRRVRSLDEVIVEMVPAKLMKSVYDFTLGYKAGSGAKQINMVLVHPSAVITPEKYAFSQLDPPSAGSEGKYEYYEESYDDTFLLNQRKGGIMFNVEAGE